MNNIPINYKGYEVVELSKKAFQSVESIIGPMQRLIHAEYGKANFIAHEFLFTYKEDTSKERQ